MAGTKAMKQTALAMAADQAALESARHVKPKRRESLRAEIGRRCRGPSSCAAIEPSLPKAGRMRPPSRLRRVMRIQPLPHWGSARAGCRCKSKASKVEQRTWERRGRVTA